MLNWIYLYRVKVIPIATGVSEFYAYVKESESEKAAIKKVKEVISGNYEVQEAEIVGELYDFGSDVFTPEIF